MSWKKAGTPTRGYRRLDRSPACRKAEAEPQPAYNDELGGIILESAGHPGAEGASSQVQKAGYAVAPPAQGCC